MNEQAEKITARWNRVPRYEAEMSSAAPHEQCAAALDAALAINPALADGDGDLNGHVRVRAALLRHQSPKP